MNLYLILQKYLWSLVFTSLDCSTRKSQKIISWNPVILEIKETKVYKDNDLPGSHWWSEAESELTFNSQSPQLNSSS